MSLSLYDTMKAAPGLVAYWPLVDNTDHSGNGRNLELVGAPSFAQSAMTTDLHPSVQTPQPHVALRIRQDTLPKIVAIEGWFRLAGAKTADYSTVMGLNQPLSSYASRYIMTYAETIGFCSYQNFDGLNTVVTYKSDLTWDALSVGSHHFVLQFDSGSNVTLAYIDGVLAGGMTVPFDVFLQLANTYLVLGAFYYNGGTRGACQLSDVAIYNRMLSSEEIAQRQSFTISNVAPDIKRITAPAPCWAAPFTQAQAWPGENHWSECQHSSPTMAVPITQVPHLASPPGRPELGYIAGVVTVKNVPAVGRLVRCFDPSMMLVAETSSAADGSYRFDNLLRNRLYLILAQDNDSFDYSPASADRRKPEAYAA